MNYTKFYKILVINNIMKHFFLERHCVYDKATKGLNKEGFLQAMIMAQEIKRIADNYHNVVLISSPARRAQETIEPVAKILGASYHIDSRLQPIDWRILSYQELCEIDDMIKPFINNDIIVLSSHYEVLGPYPQHALKTLCDKHETIRLADRGELWHLDLKTGLYEFLPKRIKD